MTPRKGHDVLRPLPCVAALLALRRLPEAERAYRQLVAERPADASALAGLGQVALRQRRDGEAAALLRETGRALIVPPDNVSAIGEAIATLAARRERGELDVAPLGPGLREQLSRGARAAELADLLQRL